MLQDGTYKCQPGASKIHWTGRMKLAETTESGTVSITDGTIEVKDGVPTSGTFTIDMNTISPDSGSEKLETHLKSEDFFEVETYPEASFTLLEADRTKDDDTYTIRGELNMKGITHEIAFPATMTQDGDTAKAHAEFLIDRSKWKVKYGSESFFKDLGDKVIKDQVELTIDLAAEKS